MSYEHLGYNPVQARLDSLAQQKAMIEQQMQSLQNIAVPPININNNIPQATPPTGSFDFHGKWVDTEEQAKQIANNNLPLLLLDNNEPIFYMKDTNGSLKKYRFEEIQEAPKESEVDSRINSLENKLDNLILALNRQNTPSEVTTPKKEESPSKAQKEVNKGGNK